MAGPGGILFNTLAGAEPSAGTLKPGQTVRAVVASQSGDSVALRVAGQVIEARLAALLTQNPNAQITTGSVLRFSVETGTDGLLLRLLPATTSTSASASTSGSTPQSQAPAASAPAAPSRSATSPAQAGSVPNQAGTSPSAAGQGPPTTGAPSSGAAQGGPQTIGGQAANAANGPPGQQAQPAITRAPTSSAPPASPAGTRPEVTIPQQQPSQSVAAERSAAVREATAQSAPRQGGAAQLVSRLGSVENLSRLPLAQATSGPGQQGVDAKVTAASLTPTGTTTATTTTQGAQANLDVFATRVLGLQLSPDPATGEISSSALKDAVQRNGPFLEAMLAAGRPEAAGTAKAQFGGLMALIGQLLGGRERSGAIPTPMGSPQSVAQAPGQSAQQGAPQPSSPPLPQPGGGPKPQAPVPPMAGLSGDPVEILQMLSQDAEGALHRARLLQLASLPDADFRGGGAEKPAEWHMDIPLRQGDSQTTLGMTISREPPDRRKDEDGNPVWRVRLAVELEEAGPIHALIHLVGGRLQVGLWAEKDQTARRLKQDSATLRDLLQTSALEVEDISIDQGVPPTPGQPTAASGLLIDQTS